jgi:integrase/recombinase XerD
VIVLKEYVLPEIAKKFVNNRRLKSERTKKDYMIELSIFFEYVIEKRRWTVSVSEISDTQLARIVPEDIENYIDKKKKNGKVASDNTKSKRREIIASFFWYITNDYTNKKIEFQNPVKGINKIKIGKRLPKVLTLEQSRMLLNSVKSENYERDYAIVNMFLQTGLRISELVGINLNHIEENILRVIGKGDKEREIPLNEACLRSINNYLKVRPKSRSDALFLTEEKSRISIARVRAIVKNFLTKIGLPDMSPHKLRATAATLMFNEGNIDVYTIKEILGHESITTTERYTKVGTKKLQNAVNSNPLNVITE